MKKILPLILASIILFSCNSAKKALQHGSYETACMLAIKKLQKKPSDEDNAKIFTLAYQKANQKNIDRIEYLKQSKEQKAWDEVLKLYKKLERRQELAETILPLRAGGKTVNFEHINYNEQIIEAKNSAAYFHYNEGIKLLSGDKNDARKAYQHLVNVRNYTNNYTDLEQRIKQAEEKGISNILISTINKTTANLSPTYMSDLINFGMQHVDDTWRRYYNSPQLPQFDYSIFVVINSVYSGPNNTKKSKDIVKKEVRDGWKYKLDQNGNVKKDSLGNDIKEPNYKIISCTITKKIQTKIATVKATVELQDNKTKRIVSSIPIQSGSKFSYISSYANGNLDALDDDLRQTIDKSPAPFPLNETMIEETSNDLRNKVINAIKRSRNLIK